MLQSLTNHTFEFTVGSDVALVDGKEKKIAAKFLNLLIKHHNLSKRICPFVYIEMLSPNRWGKFDDEMVRFINRLFSKDKEVTNEKENSDDNMTND